MRGWPITVQRNRLHADPSLRELKNAVPLAETMGLSMNTVQRMLGASLVASLGVWFLQGTVMDAVLTLIALCALTGVVWALSERESTFAYLNLNGSGRGTCWPCWPPSWFSHRSQFPSGRSPRWAPTSSPCRSSARSGDRLHDAAQWRLMHIETPLLVRSVKGLR